MDKQNKITFHFNSPSPYRVGERVSGSVIHRFGITNLDSPGYVDELEEYHARETGGEVWSNVTIVIYPIVE